MLLFRSVANRHRAGKFAAENPAAFWTTLLSIIGPKGRAFRWKEIWVGRRDPWLPSCLCPDELVDLSGASPVDKLTSMVQTLKQYAFAKHWSL